MIYYQNIQISSQIWRLTIIDQMQFIRQAQQIFSTNLPYLYYFIIMLGVGQLIKHLFRYIYGAYKLLFRKRLNLIQRYGQKSWALVTGSSEGIGKEFALQLAASGFNIILLARTQSKLKDVQKEIKEKYSQVEVDIIIADLMKQGQKENLNDILPELSRYNNISIVVNNAGVDVLDQYTNQSLSTIIGLININCFALTALNYKFIGVFEERLKKTGLKSAFINVGSIAGEIPMPYHNVYSASKGYVGRLTRNLAIEYPHIDWLLLKPGEVSTAMTCFKKLDILTIDSQSCVAGTLDDLGYNITTNGNIRHKIQNYFFAQFMEVEVFNWFWSKYFAPEFMKQKQRYYKNRQKQS